jgi:hypothetical protein
VGRDDFAAEIEKDRWSTGLNPRQKRIAFFYSWLKASNPASSSAKRYAHEIITRATYPGNKRANCLRSEVPRSPGDSEFSFGELTGPFLTLVPVNL